MTITNYWSTAPSLTTASQVRSSDPGSTWPAPASVTLTQFMNWSLTDQIAFLKAKETGDPESVSIGPTGSTITLSYNKTSGLLDLSSTSIPEPQNLNAEDFAVWTLDSQVAYINAKGTGSP